MIRLTGDYRDRSRSTPLHWAVMLEDVAWVRFFVKKQILLEARDVNGYTAIMIAAGQGNINILSTLIHGGAKLNARSSACGSSALHLSAAWGKTDAVNILLHTNRVTINARDNDGMRPIDRARHNNNQGAVKLLTIAERCQSDLPPVKVIEAGPVISSLPGKITRLRSRSANRDKHGCTPIHWASRFGDNRLVKNLIHDGKDLNSLDPNGKTPLMLAIEESHYATASALLRAGADANLTDASGRSPLHAACIVGQQNLVRLLLRDRNIDTNIKSNGGTPLEWAEANGHKAIVQLFRRLPTRRR